MNIGLRTAMWQGGKQVTTITLTADCTNAYDFGLQVQTLCQAQGIDNAIVLWSNEECEYNRITRLAILNGLALGLSTISSTGTAYRWRNGQESIIPLISEYDDYAKAGDVYNVYDVTAPTYQSA